MKEIKHKLTGRQECCNGFQSIYHTYTHLNFGSKQNKQTALSGVNIVVNKTSAYNGKPNTTYTSEADNLLLYGNNVCKSLEYNRFLCRVSAILNFWTSKFSLNFLCNKACVNCYKSNN